MRKTTEYLRITLVITALLWLGLASASTVTGIAVDAPGGDLDDKVGLIGDGPDLTNAIEYYIPLNGPGPSQYSSETADYTGTYGVAGTSPCSQGAGTCSDLGRGTGYSAADALKMNIFFDLSLQLESQSATFFFLFDDLDLTPGNDPDDFYESLSLSYWDSTAPGTDSSNFNLVGMTGVMTDESHLPASSEAVDNPNLITWELDLLALHALNTSQSNAGGFWLQLGFGSDFSGHKGWNTPEYLAVSLELAPVPVPAAFWLFGTALVGFIGFSRRRTI